MISPPIIVAIMGVTGSGKTSYVASLTGRGDIVPSEDLEASTAEITAYDAQIDGVNFRIVDTPGFNDTYRTESQILAKLADWLNSTYRDGQKLTGLIYLHSIATSRMSGTSRLNLAMFQKLCGLDSCQNITLCTTFWNSVAHGMGERRESQLLKRDDFWGNMIKKGARTERIFDYSDDNSKSVILRFAEEEEVVLTVQKEMVDNNMPLEQTAASQVVNAELDQATGVLESLRIGSKKIEENLARRKINRQLQAQQNIKHQQSIQQLKEKYKKDAEERERQALEAKEKEKRMAEERLKRQKEESRRAAEQRAAAEKEQAVREAERRETERKRKEEILRQRTTEQFRTIFAKQCRKLFSVQCNSNLAIPCYKNEDQHPGYLRWCDNCFVPITTQSHFHCQQCQFDICSSCWDDGGRCKGYLHNPRYIVPGNLQGCSRIAHTWGRLKCDFCGEMPPGLFFHCCSCSYDDFDICLECVLKGRSCLNRYHKLHPIATWPHFSTVVSESGLDSLL